MFRQFWQPDCERQSEVFGGQFLTPQKMLQAHGNRHGIVESVVLRPSDVSRPKYSARRPLVILPISSTGVPAFKIRPMALPKRWAGIGGVRPSI